MGNSHAGGPFGKQYVKAPGWCNYNIKCQKPDVRAENITTVYIIPLIIGFTLLRIYTTGYERTGEQT